MLLEYAVEPQAIGSSRRNFQLLMSQFGFDRGRLISQYPKAWFREVYIASEAMKPIERKRLEDSFDRAKKFKVIRSGRPYDPTPGGWLTKAIAQQALSPFHAIIAEQNPLGHPQVLIVDDVDDHHPLLVAPHTWDVDRVGLAIAGAMRLLLESATTVLFVDRFFDISKTRYQETLKACLDVIHTSGGNGVRCEIHFCDHDKRPPPEYVEREAHKWIRGVLPAGMSFALFSWKEREGGADFHARYLLTNLGGINVESGFSAEGAHQKVQLGLLPLELAHDRLNALVQNSTVYDLVGPVLEIRSDGSVTRI